MVIVDTSAWVSFLKSPVTPEGKTVKELVERQEALLVGMVLAELLHGLGSDKDLADLLDAVAGVSYLECTRETWERAGLLARRLRRDGRQLPMSDIVVAALAVQHNLPLYTLDKHFEQVPGVRLYRGTK
jgi:predicted nucleic acid-binding protein